MKHSIFMRKLSRQILMSHYIIITKPLRIYRWNNMIMH